MVKYCKPDLINKLHKFNQWSEEKPENTKKEIDGQKVEVNRNLTDDNFLYLQENYIVPDGILANENIIFAHVTCECQEFCNKTIEFEVSVYEPVNVKASVNQEKSNS